MYLDVDTTPRVPSERSTVPRLRAVPSLGRHDVSKLPRWAKRVRTESHFVSVTVWLDVWSASWSVVFAQLWTANAEHDNHGFGYSLAFVPLVVAVLAARSMYRRRVNHSFLDDLEPLQTAIAVSALLMLTVMLVFFPSVDPDGSAAWDIRPTELILRVWVCAAVVMPAVRLIRSIAQRYLRRKFGFGAPALIVGSGPIAHQLITRMRQVPDYGLRPVGLLDDVRPTDVETLDLPYFGTAADLELAVRATAAEELIVGPSSVSDEQLARTAQLAQRLGLRVRVVPRLMDAVGNGAWVEHLGGVPLLVLSSVDPKGWQFAVKHAAGRILAGLGLLVISPVFLGLVLLVRLSSPGPIFFRQQRVGRDGKVFDCLKFRSMRPLDPAKAAFDLQAGAAPGGVEGDDRRTRIGKIMRQTSLDELPQLLNVVKGDMALVGPRPERPEYVELFEMQIRRYGERHRVKAGMTGWAQVHGLRGQTSIADRAEFDNYYIENWSLLLDIKILLLTVLAVLHKAED